MMRASVSLDEADAERVARLTAPDALDALAALFGRHIPRSREAVLRALVVLALDSIDEQATAAAYEQLAASTDDEDRAHAAAVRGRRGDAA